MKIKMSKMLAVLTVLALMLSSFVTTALAAEDTNLLVNYASNNEAYSAVTTNADGSVTVDVTQGVDAQGNAYGLAVEPRLSGLNVKKDGGQGFILLEMESEVPFRITMLDRTTGMSDKWIMFGSEFFNVLVPEGFEFADPNAPTFGEAMEDVNGLFCHPGKYKVALYVGGIYEWKAANGEADKYDPTNASITALYFEAKNPGSFTVNSMVLSESQTFDEPTVTTTTTETTDTDVTTTTVSGETTTTTTTTAEGFNKPTAVATENGLTMTLSACEALSGNGNGMAVNVELTNTNNYDVDDISVKVLVPDGYVVDRNKSNEAGIARIAAGQTVEKGFMLVPGTGENGSDTTTTVPKGSGNTVKNPHTGDTASTIAIIACVLSAGVAVLLLTLSKNRQARRLMSLVLCAAMVSAGVAAAPSMTANAQSVPAFSTNVKLETTAWGEPFTVEVVVSNDLNGCLKWTKEDLETLTAKMLLVANEAAEANLALKDGQYGKGEEHNERAMKFLTEAQEFANENAILPIVGSTQDIQGYMEGMQSKYSVLIDDSMDTTGFTYGIQTLAFMNEVTKMSEYINEIAKAAG